MAIPYPCIDTGYIYDPGKKLDRLMSDFYEAEWSQSYLFQGAITSFPYILQMYQDDTTKVANKTRDSLVTYLGKYFDNVEIESGVMETNSSTSYNLRIYVAVTQGLEVVKLSTQLKVSGTQFEKSLQIRE